MPTDRPKTALTGNHWYIEFGGTKSPHFQSITGLRKSTGTVEVVDGGSNIKYKFSGQIKDFGSITLERPMDNSVIDYQWEAFVNGAIDFGVLYDNVFLVKIHNNVEVFKIVMSGVHFNVIELGDFSMTDEQPLMHKLEATVNEWIKIPS